MSLDQSYSCGAKTPSHASKLQIKSESENTILEKLFEFARSVPDFRRSSKGNIRHNLADIIMLLIFARLSKCITRVEIIAFGKHSLVRLQKMGMFKNGIPSEATLCRVESGIDELGMADRMQQFAEGFYKEMLKVGLMLEIICIDGKAQCGTVLPNGRNPDIVSAFVPGLGITLATEACLQKSNEIKAVPLLLDKIDIRGKIITADAMSMQKEIIDKIRDKGGNFLIELKANQRALRYGVEDRLKQHAPLHSYTYGPELAHGRIETRTYRIYDGLSMIADKAKWGGSLTIVEYDSKTVKKSTGAHSSEKRLYMTNLSPDNPRLGIACRTHWAIESMHWCLDFNLLQDKIKRKTAKAARNLDTIQRIVYNVFSIWKASRKKRADKKKGMAELMRNISLSFTILIRFLSQKLK